MPLLHRPVMCARCKVAAFCSKACEVFESRRAHKHACTPIRFEVGARVLCSRGALDWAKGRVVRHSYEKPEGVFHPYQVRLNDGELIFASQDHDGYIQKAFCGAGPLSRDARGRLEEAGRLHDAQDWRGAAAMDSEVLAIAREVQGDWPQLAAEVHEVLGLCYFSTGDYGRARELHEQHRAMCEALGHRAGVAAACTNLGNCYYRTGDFGRARELHEQAMTIFEELAAACSGLGSCCLSTGEYGRAVSCFTQQYNVAKKLQVGKDMTDAALGIGVALRLEIRAKVHGRAAGASELPGPHSSASACGDDGVREAEKWLQTALDGGDKLARLHLAHLVFDAGSEDTALAHLQDYLSWCVERGRSRCAGCYQKRGENAQMLTCGGCRVARFCSADHQKMASKSVSSGGRALLSGRHKDICGLLGKWRGVEKDDVSRDSLREDLLAFLRQRQ